MTVAIFAMVFFIGVNAMYEDKESRMKRHKEQATAVNKQFAIVTDEQPNKHDYRHANMRSGFRNGKWLD